MFVHAAPNNQMNPPIQSRIDQKSEQALSDLAWKQQYLTLVFQDWVQIAHSSQINIDKQEYKLRKILHDRPEINHPTQHEVWLLYETTLLNILTVQIIRKIAKTKVQETAHIARNSHEFQHIHGLIDRCENFLLERLPPKLPQMISVEGAVEKYHFIRHELKKMTKKILRKAKNIS